MQEPILPVIVPNASPRPLEEQQTQTHKHGDIFDAPPVAPHLSDAPMETAPQETGFMTEADVWALPDLPASAPITREFVLNGQKRKMTFSTDALVDPEKYVNLIIMLQGEREDDGTPKATKLEVPLPGHGKITITDRVYLSTLKLLAETVTSPKMSVEAWAVLGSKIGAKGREKGWHGIQDIGDFASKANGLSRLRQAEDEKRAGEKPSGGTS